MTKWIVALLMLASASHAGTIMYIEPSGGGGKPFTSFTNYPVDFEANQTCTTYAAIDVGAEWDCQTASTPAPLNGSYSAYNTADGGDLRFRGSYPSAQNGTIYIMFLLHVETMPTATSAPILETKAVSADAGFEIRIDGTNGHLIGTPDTGSDVNASDSSFAEDTTYRICAEYDIANDDLTIYQDAAGGTYCTTSVLTVDGTGTPADVDGFDVGLNTTGGVFYLDDVDTGS